MGLDTVIENRIIENDFICCISFKILKEVNESLH